MYSKYEIFCAVADSGNFTRTAEQLGYSQSAISQIIKSLEQELGTVLFERLKSGVTLTSDGQNYMPYLRAIAAAENDLKEKQKEMIGLQSSVIRIGTFASVSQPLLPPLIKQFRQTYPSVHFVLQQGHYTDIANWLLEGTIDLGFTNTNSSPNLALQPLFHDQMMAVLPADHRLSSLETVSLHDLISDPFILLDEGDYSLALKAFSNYGLTPNIEYKVYNDNAILAMIRQGLGVSLMYRLALFEEPKDIVIRPISESVERTISLTWRNWDTLPLAAKKFADYIIKHTNEILPTSFL